MFSQVIVFFGDKIKKKQQKEKVCVLRSPEVSPGSFTPGRVTRNVPTPQVMAVMSEFFLPVMVLRDAGLRFPLEADLPTHIQVPLQKESICLA